MGMGEISHSELGQLWRIKGERAQREKQIILDDWEWAMKHKGNVEIVMEGEWRERQDKTIKVIRGRRKDDIQYSKPLVPFGFYALTWKDECILAGQSGKLIHFFRG